jgi:hypothetical protein
MLFKKKVTASELAVIIFDHPAMVEAVKSTIANAAKGLGVDQNEDKTRYVLGIILVAEWILACQQEVGYSHAKRQFLDYSTTQMAMVVTDHGRFASVEQVFEDAKGLVTEVYTKAAEFRSDKMYAQVVPDPRLLRFCSFVERRLAVQNLGYLLSGLPLLVASGLKANAELIQSLFRDYRIVTESEN